LLDWTFESLALAGVQEVFVLCRSHPAQVKKAIRYVLNHLGFAHVVNPFSDSKWSKPGSVMKIVPVMTAKETFSAGDAMRDIYTRGLVSSDFVLVMGDLVSNIRIDEVVRAHKERRKTNKDAIMTMVVKEASVEHRTR
jgi:translation initiation factor eIF-2B subunit epsilon